MMDAALVFCASRSATRQAGLWLPQCTIVARRVAAACLLGQVVEDASTPV